QAVGQGPLEAPAVQAGQDQVAAGSRGEPGAPQHPPGAVQGPSGRRRATRAPAAASSRSPRPGRTGLLKVPRRKARSAGVPPAPPSKMYRCELRPGAKLVTPSSSLIPSRKQVLPEPLGPVATLIPSTSRGIGSGRSDPQWTSCTSSIRGIVPPRFLVARFLVARFVVARFLVAVELGGPAPQVGEALVAGDQGSGLVGGARLVQGVEQRPRLDPPLAHVWGVRPSPA